MHCIMCMPVNNIIRGNGEQCMMQMPVKITLWLYCDACHIFPVSVKSSMYCDTVALLLSIVYKTATVKLHECEGKMEVPVPQPRVCYIYMCKEVTRGQPRPIDLKSSFISCYIISSKNRILVSFALDLVDENDVTMHISKLRTKTFTVMM